MKFFLSLSDKSLDGPTAVSHDSHYCLFVDSRLLQLLEFSEISLILMALTSRFINCDFTIPSSASQFELNFSFTVVSLYFDQSVHLLDRIRFGGVNDDSRLDNSSRLQILVHCMLCYVTREGIHPGRSLYLSYFPFISFLKIYQRLLDHQI